MAPDLSDEHIAEGYRQHSSSPGSASMCDANDHYRYQALAMAMRDRLMGDWMATDTAYETDNRVVPTTCRSSS